MLRKARVAILVAALGSWAGLSPCSGQNLPPGPVPADAGPTNPPVGASPAPALTPPPPPTYGLPPDFMAAPPPPAFEDRNGPLLRNDPLLDRSGSAPPGWFAAIDLDILIPHVNSTLAGSVNVGGLYTDAVQLPQAGLDWTVSPKLVLGYRLDQGLGEISIAFRSVSTSGTDFLPNFDLDGSDGTLKTRLDMNIVDIDYGSEEYSLGPNWGLKWTAGVRIADVFFDSHAYGYYLDEQTSNEFVGAGPRLGLSVTRNIGSPEFAVYAHVDGSALVGDIKQTFQESVALTSGVYGGTNTAHQDQFVPVLNAELGLCWAPRFSHHALRFSGGYQFEQWWYVGQENGNHADVLLQGVFLRGEWSF